MATVIVQQPDDVPYIGVSENNPYKTQEDRLTTDEPRQMYFGETVAYVPATVVRLSSELEQSATFLRFVTAFDTTLSFMNFILSGELIFLGVSLCNYIGYRGSRNFFKKYIYFYVFFQMFNSTSKIVFICMSPSIEPEIATIIGLSAFFNLITVWFAFRFVRLIPNS
jgi:hypothetical protein